MNFTTCKDRLTSPWLVLVLIIITTVIIYSNIYNAPFVFDDIPQIVDREQTRDLSHYSSPKQILKDRNIVYLTFAINYKLCGFNVVGYHITNVLIHIVNGFLVYLLSLIIFKRLSKVSLSSYSIRQKDVGPARRPVPARMQSGGKDDGQAHQKNVGQAIALMSIFTALIFIAHPIQTQAVTYTVQRMASMAAMFYMASVFFYLKARINAQSSMPSLVQSSSIGPKISVQAASTTKPFWRASQNQQDSTHRQESNYYLTFYFLSGFCGALALLSKQSAVSLPGAILLVEYLFVNRAWQGWKKMIPWFALSFAFWVLFVSYTQGFLGVFISGSGSGNLLEDISDLSKIGLSVSRWEYLCTQFNVLVIYIRLLFLPIHQCLDYLYPIKDGFLDGYTPIAFSFLMGLVGIGVWNIRKRPIISLAVFWFFITLSVESSIIPLYAYFEHRLYLPMFGFAIFVTWLLFHLFPNKRSWVIVGNVVVIILFGTATYHRNGVWQDEMKLWSDTVSKSPKNHKAHYNLGRILGNEGKLDDARTHYKEALRIKPDYIEAHNNLGVNLVEKGKLDDALFCLKEALRINPDFAQAHNNMGNVLLKQDKLDEALTHYKEALRIDPDYAEAHNSIGITLTKKGKLDEALTHYKEALRVNPDYAEAHNNWGGNLVKEGKLDDALFHFKEALQIKPNDVGVRNNLQRVLSVKEHYNKGIVLDSKGQVDDAITEYRKALQIIPDYAEAHNNLGVALAKKGSYKDALVHFSRAIHVKPDYAEAHFNMGTTLANQNKPSEAIEHFTEAIKINPNYVKTYVNLGAVLLGLGKLDESIAHFSEALQIKPDYAKAHNHLGLALARKGNLNEAVTHFSEALRINPGFNEAQHNLELALKEIGENDKSLKAVTTP